MDIEFAKLHGSHDNLIVDFLMLKILVFNSLFYFFYKNNY